MFCLAVTMEEEVMDAESSSGLNRKGVCSHGWVTEHVRGRRISGAAAVKGSAFQLELCVKGSLGGSAPPVLVNIECSFPEAPQAFQRWAVSPCVYP